LPLYHWLADRISSRAGARRLPRTSSRLTAIQSSSTGCCNELQAAATPAGSHRSCHWRGKSLSPESADPWSTYLAR
jgi:hypothetical protein